MSAYDFYVPGYDGGDLSGPPQDPPGFTDAAPETSVHILPEGWADTASPSALAAALTAPEQIEAASVRATGVTRAHGLYTERGARAGQYVDLMDNAKRHGARLVVLDETVAEATTIADRLRQAPRADLPHGFDTARLENMPYDGPIVMLDLSEKPVEVSTSSFVLPEMSDDHALRAAQDELGELQARGERPTVAATALWSEADGSVAWLYRGGASAGVLALTRSVAVNFVDIRVGDPQAAAETTAAAQPDTGGHHQTTPAWEEKLQGDEALGVDAWNDGTRPGVRPSRHKRAGSGGTSLGSWVQF